MAAHLVQYWARPGRIDNTAQQQQQRCQPHPVTARRFAFLSLLCPPPPLPPPCLCARSPHDLRPETYSWSSTPLPLGTSKSDRVSLREGSHRGLTVTVFLHPNALLPVHPGGGTQGAFPLWRPPVVISNNNNNNTAAGASSARTAARLPQWGDLGGLPPLEALSGNNQ